MRWLVFFIMLFVSIPAYAQQTAANDAVPDTTKFTSVCKVDSSIAWAVGSNGKLAKSIDGGLTWNNVTINGINQSDYDFQDVCFVDERKGWVVGYKNNGEEKNFGILLKTINGSTWFVELIRSYPFLSIKMEQSPTVVTGYIGCGDGKVLKYDGTTWWRTRKLPSPNADLLKKGDKP